MLPPKRNIIKIKNIPIVEKYVPGLKPSSVSEKEEKSDKCVRKVLMSDKYTKSPATKAPTKKP